MQLQSKYFFQIGFVDVSTERKVMSDDHSEVAPLLPIPNRTVKRLSADDSADYLCESRSSSDSSESKSPGQRLGLLLFALRVATYLNEVSIYDEIDVIG